MKRILLFLLLFISCSLFSAEMTEAVVKSTDTLKLPDFSINEKSLLTENSKVTIEKYPDADSVTLDGVEAVAYRPDGTGLAYVEYYEKILTEKGRKDNRTLSIYIIKPYHEVELKTLEIIKSDGTRSKIDIAKNSRTMVNSGQMRSNIYNPNFKVMKVSVPGLKVGDILHCAWLRKTVKVRMKDAFCDFFTLQSTEPIIHFQIIISAPLNKPLTKYLVKDQIAGTVKFTRKKLDNNIIYSWEVGNSPQIYKEPGMPSVHCVAQRLLVSTLNGWDDVSKWYWLLCEPHLQKVTPEMRKTVAEITANAATPLEKARAIFDFVSKKIRYMGLTTEKESPGNEPHDVNITFENRYGVCRDKAALLAAMLRLADIKAFPVLIDGGDKKDKEVANNYFNHAVVAAELSPEKYTLMDPTDENSKQFLPSYLDDKSYLVCRPEGETLRTSAVIPAKDNLLRISTEAAVLDDSSITGTVKFSFEGINDNIYRGAFARWKPQLRQQFFERQLKHVIPGAKVTELKIKPEDLRDLNEGLSVEMKFSGGSAIVSGNDASLLKIPFFGEGFGAISFALRNIGLTKRKYPLKFFSTCGTQEQISLTLPPGLKDPVVPAFKKLDGALSWQRNIKVDENKVSADSSFMLDKVEIDPKEYLELKKSLREVEYESQKNVIFRNGKIQIRDLGKLYTEADTAIISRECSYEILSPSKYTQKLKIKKKILTYAGLKKNSEIKISYNPCRSKVSIENVRITNPDGKVHKLKSEELNLMDAPWTGSAPRYPAEKVLVASLPGVMNGSTIEFELISEHANQSFFSLYHDFADSDPVLDDKVTITAAPNVKLKVGNTSFPVEAAEVKRNDKQHFYSFSSANLPVIRPERNQAPWWMFNARLSASGGNWSVYAASLNAIISRCAQKGVKTAEKARELCANAKCDLEKIQLIRDFAATRIRSAGPAFTALPLDSLSDADTVLNDGYGHSADQAILLLAMLNAVGIESEVILASGTDMLEAIKDRISNYPDYRFFSAVLLKIDLDGRTIYLNDTNQYGWIGTCAHQHKICLDESGNISKLEVDKSFGDRREVSENIILGSGCIALIELNEKYYGTNYNSFHQSFAEMTPEKRDKHFQNLASNYSQSAKITCEPVTDYAKYPGRMNVKIAVDNFLIREADYAYFKFHKFPVVALNAERKTPYYRHNFSDFVCQYNIKLPTDCDQLIMKPENLFWQSPRNSGFIKVESVQNGDMLTVRCTLKLKPVVLTPNEYQQMRRFIDKLSSEEMTTVMFKTKSPAAQK